MKPAVKFPLLLLLVVACALLVVRCHRLLQTAEQPELSLYEGLGVVAAREIQRLAPGEGPWLVVAMEPAGAPRFAAMVDAFKGAARGAVVWHFLPGDQALRFQGDGLGSDQLQQILTAQPPVRGVVVLGGGFRPGGPARKPDAPAVLAGPMNRDLAAAAVAGGQLAAAIVYRDTPAYEPGARPERQFNNSFEVLRAP